MWCSFCRITSCHAFSARGRAVQCIAVSIVAMHSHCCGPAAAFEDSHKTFREAMPGGFAWEAVDVYSGYVQTPPHSCFSPFLSLLPCNITSLGQHVMYCCCRTMPQKHMQAEEKQSLFGARCLLAASVMLTQSISAPAF